MRPNRTRREHKNASFTNAISNMMHISGHFKRKTFNNNGSVNLLPTGFKEPILFLKNTVVLNYKVPKQISVFSPGQQCYL